jgi:biopolymer transport protein TolR
MHVAVVFSFVLFVFFLALPPQSACGGLRATLPRVGHPVPLAHANREDAMTISILRDSKVFFRNEPVRLDQLPGKIRESINQGSEKKVYISADARAQYGWVAEVLDSVHSSGVEKVAFLVDQRVAPAPNAQ